MLRLIKHIGSALFVGTLIYFVLLAVFFFTGRFDDGFSYARALKEYYGSLIVSVILYLINAYWIQFLIVKYKSVLHTKKFFLIGISGNIVLSLIGIFVSRLILRVGIEKRPLTEFLQGEKMEYYQIALLIAIAISIVFYAAWYFKYRQERKVKEQKIIAGTASAKFDALKNQLDPHFLFNSLNVLNSLIEENPESATRFTTSLSKVYRYVLEQKSKELVPLEEELKFAKLYMSLLTVRFEDSIVFSSPSHLSNPQAKVVPLSLQLLLENAVKHNQVTSSKKLYISIYEENGNLVVSNNIQQKQSLKESTGVGLQNIKDRYALLTDMPVVIHKNREEFSVAIPILKEDFNVINTQET